MDRRDRLDFIAGAVELRHPHATQALRRYGQALATELPLLHEQSVACRSHSPAPAVVLLPVTQLPPFQTLLDAHGRDVHRFLVASVGAHEADDCYQETWIAALRAYPKLRDASNLRGWLLTIASHKVIDHLRARRRTAIPVGDAPADTASVDAAPAGLAGTAGAGLGVDGADLDGIWTTSAGSPRSNGWRWRSDSCWTPTTPRSRRRCRRARRRRAATSTRH